MYVWIQDIIIENGYLWYKSSWCAYIEEKKNQSSFWLNDQLVTC